MSLIPGVPPQDTVLVSSMRKPIPLALAIDMYRRVDMLSALRVLALSSRPMLGAGWS